MFFVDWDEMPQFTAVPDSFILKHLTEAPGDFVKLYIYLLMCSHKKDIEPSFGHLKNVFGFSDSELKSALKYWEERKLLEIYYQSGEIVGIKLRLNTSEKTKDSHRLSQSRVKSLMSSSDDAATLCFATEQYMGRPLTSIEISTLLYFMDELGFSLELCEYLVEYCISKEHRSIRYIEKVGLAWHKAGYRTVQEAKENSNTWSKIHFDVLKAFGISGRNPTKKQSDYINKWYHEYGFSLEMISEACSITLTQTGKQSFEYADGILTRWHESGLKNLNEVKKVNAEFKAKNQHSSTPKKNSFVNFEQRNDDLDELERMLDKQFADNGGK